MFWSRQFKASFYISLWNECFEYYKGSSFLATKHTGSIAHWSLVALLVSQNRNSSDTLSVPWSVENRCFSFLFNCVGHCVKSVRIRSFSCPYFPIFELNTERYFVFSSNAGKYGPEKPRIWTHFTQWYLKILTGKKHPQIKLQRLRKVWIWIIG